MLKECESKKNRSSARLYFGRLLNMHKMLLVPSLLILSLTSTAAQDRQVERRAKASDLFGQPLSEHAVFRLNARYVLWLITAADGTLLAVDVGPQSYYSTEFPTQQIPSGANALSQSEIDEALSRISQLKEIGRLKQKQYGEAEGISGPLQTDEYENAFVEKVLRPKGSSSGVGDAAWMFSVYYTEEVSGSPKQIVFSDNEPAEVCLGNIWYYLTRSEAHRLRIGKWTTFRAAGTERISRQCFRTTVLYDADGFTIEEPANETIVAAEPYTVRQLVGSVHLGDTPLEGVNVEILATGTKDVVRVKTDAKGRFRLFPTSRAGHYKFKVTKDGFKSLTGTIIVDPAAPVGSLTFELPVGT